jgi:hypothetical protein
VCAEEGSRGGEQGRGRERATRGSRPSRRWSGGGSTATAARCPALAAEGAEQSSMCQRRKKEEGGGGSEGLIWKNQKF